MRIRRASSGVARSRTEVRIVLMQPGLAGAGGSGDQEVRHPREVGPDGVAGDVLPEPDRQRARRRRELVEDVAERDEVRRQVRDLDADGLLARDRRQDADLGRRQRVREVVLERRDLGHLRPGGELELVASDARAGDLADDPRASTPKSASARVRDSATLPLSLLPAARAGARFRSDGSGRT